MISALEKKCHVSVTHPKKLLMWLVWLVPVVHIFINLLTILYSINHYYLNQIVTSHYNCSVWRRKLEICETTWQKRRERGRSKWTQGYSSLPEFHLQSCNDWGQLSPDWDENDADLCVPGGSRMSRYLDTIRTEMKYNSAKERNWACLVSSTSLESRRFHFHFST